LPDDFPDVEKWSDIVTKLYEHRLRADYDNWAATRSEHQLTSEQTVGHAEIFLTEARKYLEAKYGIKGKYVLDLARMRHYLIDQGDRHGRYHRSHLSRRTQSRCASRSVALA